MPLTHQEWVELQERRRERMQEAVCPKCNAPKGSPCLGKDGKPRRSLHSQRNDVCLGRPPRENRGPRPQPSYPDETS